MPMKTLSIIILANFVTFSPKEKEKHLFMQKQQGLCTINNVNEAISILFEHMKTVHYLPKKKNNKIK